MDSHLASRLSYGRNSSNRLTFTVLLLPHPPIFLPHTLSPIIEIEEYVSVASSSGKSMSWVFILLAIRNSCEYSASPKYTRFLRIGVSLTFSSWYVKELGFPSGGQYAQRQPRHHVNTHISRSGTTAQNI